MAAIVLINRISKYALIIDEPALAVPEIQSRISIPYAIGINER